MRLRLKPKLTVEAEPETATPALSPELPSAPVVQPFPVLAPPDPVADNGEIPRLKLKPLAASGTLSAEPVPMPAAPAPVPVSDLKDVVPAPPPLPPPVPPAEMGDASVASVPLLKPLAVLKTDTPGEGGILGEILVAPPGVPFKPPERASGLSIGRLVGLGVVFLLVLGGGYYAFRMLTAPPPAAPAPVLVAPREPAPGVVAPPVPKAPVVPVTPVVQTPPAPLPVVQPPPVAVPVKPQPAPVRVAPQPSTDFLVWVDAVKISGVINSSPPRAIVNGLLVRPGDTIDSARGIVFDHLDVEQKQFFFRDRSGAITGKSY
ncbi:MAG: hypothetical protein WC661_08885 [Opitutaceae bacterium]|jgi:hypothetical protein